MSLARRPQLTQRRRRVIYSQQQGADDAAAGASRVAQLRAARRPTAVYGARVHRRLRARWFGLVPVRRRAMVLLAAAVTAVTVVMIAAHWLAMTWPPLAYRPEIARPLRLDRPDSVGTWLSTLLLAMSSGTALLVYQLRRHRADDYKGHYRLWRPAIVLSLLASIDSLVGLIDWTGALLDATLGRRAAMAGGDWVRLLLAVGGVSFGLRMIVEVRRSPTAVTALAVALLAFAFPAAVRWRIVSVASPLGWTALAASPLIARSGLWIGLMAYLRVLYREVRRIEQEDSWRERLRGWRRRQAADGVDPQAADTARDAKSKSSAAASRRLRRAATEANADDTADADTDGAASEPRRRLRRWLWPLGRARQGQPPAAAKPAAAAEPPAAKQAPAAAKQAPATKQAPAADAADGDAVGEKPSKSRRRWWPLTLRRSKSAAKPKSKSECESKTRDKAAAADEGRQTPINKPSPPQVAAASRGAIAPSTPDAAASSQPPRPARRWLKRPAWLRLGRRSSAVGDNDAADAGAGGKRPTVADGGATARRVAPPQPPAVAAERVLRMERQAPEDEDDDDEGDSDASGDLSSLSKAERRRLKRQMKRDGRAA